MILYLLSCSSSFWNKRPICLYRMPDYSKMDPLTRGTQKAYISSGTGQSTRAPTNVFSRRPEDHLTFF